MLQGIAITFIMMVLTYFFLTHNNQNLLLPLISPTGVIEGVLDSIEWRKFKIIYKDKLTYDIKLYTLELKDPYSTLGISLGESVKIRTM